MLEPLALGYLVYVAMIFLPGIGLGELLQAWKEGETLAERFAWAFGIGLSFDTLVFLVRTSGLQIGGVRLVGMDLQTIYFILGVGLVALLAGLVLHRRFAFPTKVVRTDLALGVMILGLGALLLFYFNKYPIFPEYQSPDYQNHVELAQSLLSGALTSIPSGILYYGVHYQLASTILLVGGEPLLVVQRTMALLVVLSPLLVYAASVKLFGKLGVGLLNSLVYSFSGAIWFGSVFNSGLYANFFGILVALFLLSSFLSVASAGASRSTWVVFLLSTFAAYLSHYTAVTIIGAIFLTLLLQAALSRKDARPFVAPSLVLVAPGAVVAAAYPRLVGLVFNLATQGGGSLIGATTLSDLFAPFPVLSFIALEITYDVATIILLVMAIIFAYDAVRERSAGLLLPLVWLLALLAVAPFNNSAWRFSYEALVPLTLMAGFALFSLLPKRDLTKQRRAFGGGGRGWKGGVLFLILLLILAGSWGERTVANVANGTDSSSLAQQQVYSAIYWLKDNTPKNSSYLTVSDWRFTYTGLMIGRQTSYQFESTPADATALAKQKGSRYIIVTNIVTTEIAPVPSLFPWNNFPSSSTANLALVYSNLDVRIYKVE